MRTFGLRKKLILTFAVLFLAGTMAFAWYFVHRQQVIASAALETRAREITGILARLIAPTMDRDLDKSQAEAWLAAIRGQQDILYITVRRPDGTTYLSHHDVSSPSPAVDTVAQASEPLGAILQVNEPLRWGGKEVGTLVAGFSRASVQEEMQTSARAVLLFSVALWFVALLVAWKVFTVLSRPVLAMSEQLTRLSADLAAFAQHHENVSGQQGGAMDETRGTLQDVLASAQQMIDRSSTVLGHAQRTVSGNRDVAHRIQELNNHAEKVAEILATILQVADRTDLLALNAALEGTKAGEAGRGFTLVAAEMRRLAESVMESVAGIRRLMTDMRSASRSAVVAGQESIAFSEETTRSVQDVAMVIQQQRKATERVHRGMDAIAATMSQSTTSLHRAAVTATDLVDAARRLDRLVGIQSALSSASGLGKIPGTTAAATSEE